MKELVVLLLAAVALAWCADHMSFGALREEKPHRAIFFTVLLILLLGGYAGLRTKYNDTGAYRHAYEVMQAGAAGQMSLKIGTNPLFNVINGWLKGMGVSTQNFLMFWALLTVGGYLLFLHWHGTDYPLTVFLFIVTGCYTFVFAGIKQAAAMALAVVGVHFALKRKWVLYGLLLAAGACIHPYTLLYFLVPVLLFRPWSRRTYVLLGLAVCAGFLLQPLIGTLVDITAMMGKEYTVDSFTGEGVNLFRVLVCNVPTLLSWLYRRQLFEDSTREENLMVNLAMLNGAIMFVGLFGTANYFGRLANYFLLFQSVSLPWMVKKIGGRDGRTLTIFMVLGYSAYFYYANAINQPFDQGFARLTVAEYLAQWGGNAP